MLDPLSQLKRVAVVLSGYGILGKGSKLFGATTLQSSARRLG